MATAALLSHGGAAAGSTLKVGTSAVGKLGKLTLEQVHALLLEAMSSSNTSLTGKMEEIQVDIGLRWYDMEENLHHRR